MEPHVLFMMIATGVFFGLGMVGSVVMGARMFDRNEPGLWKYALTIGPIAFMICVMYVYF